MTTKNDEKAQLKAQAAYAADMLDLAVAKAGKWKLRPMVVHERGHRPVLTIAGPLDTCAAFIEAAREIGVTVRSRPPVGRRQAAIDRAFDPSRSASATGQYGRAKPMRRLRPVE